MGHLPLADTAYLKRRCGKGRSGTSYYVRIGVPADLRDALGKRTIERSLHTSDPTKAKHLKHAVIAAILTDFERAREKTITSADIEHEAQRYFRERLLFLSTNPGDAFIPVMNDDGDTVGLEGQSALWLLEEAQANEDWPNAVVREADKIGRRYGVKLSDAQSSELCKALLKGEIEALTRTLAVQKGTVPDPPRILNARAIDPITAEVRNPTRIEPRVGRAIRVSQAAEEYFADRNRQRRSAWTHQTLGQFRTTIRLFVEFTRDAPLDTITRKDVAKFLLALGQLDPNYGRRDAAKHLSLDLLLRKHSANQRGGLSDKTLNRHSSVIAGMFDWAIREGKFEGTNPGKGHYRSGVVHEVENDATRRAFTNEELNKLLSGSLFQSAVDKRVTPAHHSVETALAWLVPIALFTGMRLDEICGLRTDDVTTEDSVVCFEIRSHEGRRLKTAAARRRMPIHSQLLQIGFASYLKHVSDQGHTYLFPALKPGGPDKKRSWYVSKRFTTYRRSVDVGSAATVFHCFRKNVATALERARVPENEAVQILGHKKLTMSYGLYSGGLDCPGLKRVIEAIQYPGLDLSHLH